MAKAAFKEPIVNKVYDCQTVPWNQLKKFEANRLKDSEKRNVKKLMAAILKGGFSFPLVIWNPNNGTDPNYVIDGAGRMAALTQLEKDGHSICDIPVVFVEAENRHDAMQKVTMASSQFGIVTAETFKEFSGFLGGPEALAPIVSISSTAFATDYLGPVVGPEEAENPRKNRAAGTKFTPPDFEPNDIIEFGPHQLMVGYEEGKPVIGKIVKFIQKEFPELDLLRNGEPLSSL